MKISEHIRKEADADFVTLIVTQGICRTQTNGYLQEVENFNEETNGYETDEDWIDGELSESDSVNKIKLQKFINDDYDDLQKYMDEPLKSAIVSINTPQIIRSVGPKFWLKWEVHSNKPLDSEEQKELMDYINGQCSDGWGESAEQKPYMTDAEDQEHFASVWDVDGENPKIIESEEEIEKEDISDKKVKTSDVKYPEIIVKLVGEDGNAFAILGRVRSEMKRNKVSEEEIKNFSHEATSGDYDHLLQTVMKWVTVK